MSLYCIADLHLSEASGKPMDVFGKSWQGYRNRIIDEWNACVGSDDTVVIPGDVSWGLTLDEAIPDLKMIDSLPGRKILIKGNHDLWWQSLTKISKALKDNGMETLSFLQNNAVRIGDYTVCGSRGWFNDGKKAPSGSDIKKITAREAIRLEMSLSDGEKKGGEKYVFLHFPPVYGGFVCEPIISVLKKYGVSRIWYGHLHNVPDVPQTIYHDGIEMVMISADRLGFRPYLITNGGNNA